MSYSPSGYWTKRNKIWEGFLRQEKAIKELLNKLDYKHPLEFGCGVGRITRLLRGDITAFDVSEEVINYARYHIPDVNFKIASLDSFRAPERSYDLVIGIEVLMHVPPSKIVGTIKKLMKYSSKYFVSLDYSPKGSVDTASLASHNFVHNYKREFDKYGNVKMIRVNVDQVLYVVEKWT